MSFFKPLRQAEAFKIPVILASLCSLSLLWLLAAVLPAGQSLRVALDTASGVLDLLILWIGWRWSWRAAACLWLSVHLVCSLAICLAYGELSAPNMMVFMAMAAFSAWGFSLVFSTLLVPLLVATLQVSLYLHDKLAVDFWSSLRAESYQTLVFAMALYLTVAVTGFARFLQQRTNQLGLQTESHLQTQTEVTHLLLQAVEKSPDPILLIEFSGHIAYANEAFLRQSGYELEQVMGQPSRLISLNGLSDEDKQELRVHLETGESWRKVLKNKRMDGSELVESVSVSPLFNAQRQITHFVEIKQDIGEMLLKEQRLQQLERFDPLTNLLNREALMQHLQALIEPVSAQGYAVDQLRRWHGLLLINLDRFKYINEALGQEAGDSLLAQVAKRIQNHLTDNAVLARIGADEFAVVLPDAGFQRLSAREYARGVALYLQAQIQGGSASTPELSRNDIKITVSVGLTVFPFLEHDSAADSAVRVVRRANIALNEAKRRGGIQIKHYDEELAAAAEQRFDVEHSLGDALQQQQLRLFFQSQVDAGDRVIGMEALVRWEHPTKGFISPAEFIAVAEESDLIVQIGDWMLDATCGFLAREDVCNLGLGISVNIAARQFQQSDFVEKVCNCIERHGIRPKQLVLELTESAILNEVAPSVAKIEALRLLGVEFSLDDFGTGYSSLAYLQHLPVQELKIDQSFVRSLGSPKSDMLVNSILQVCHGFELRVVAEGVETRAQAERLRQLAPSIVLQGYLFGRPTEANAWLSALLTQRSE